MEEKNSFGSRLRLARRKKNYTQRDLANAIGAKHNSVSNWENDQNKPDPDTIERICEVLGVTADYLLPSSRKSPRSFLLEIENRKIPLLGSVAAGEPITTAPEYDEYVCVTSEGRKADAALRVEGDSMVPRYLDGDIVFIRLQDDIEDGEVAAIQIDDAVTLKHVYHFPGGVQLISDNPAYKPMVYTLDDTDCIRVIGKAVGFQRWER